MPIVADTYPYVIGVDTHSRTHTYAILNTRTSEVHGPNSFPTHPAGRARALAWIHRHTNGEPVLLAIEGASSYGQPLTLDALTAGLEVTEVRPPVRASRARYGKTDEFDALAAARATLTCPVDQLAQPRQGDLRGALDVLVLTRDQLTRDSTSTSHELTALLRRYDLGHDARRALTPPQIHTITGWRDRATDTLEQRFARRRAVVLAKQWEQFRHQLDQNQRDLTDLVGQLAPTLLEQVGVGPVSAARILVAYSHKGRIRSKHAFARLAGAAPIPASSGNQHDARLDRFGDRALNSALYRIVQTRLLHDPETKTYFERRTKEGKSRKRIIRCLKTIIARKVFTHLNQVMTA